MTVFIQNQTSFLPFPFLSLPQQLMKKLDSAGRLNLSLFNADG